MQGFTISRSFCISYYRIVPNKRAQRVDKHPGELGRSRGAWGGVSQLGPFLAHFWQCLVKYSTPKFWGRVYSNRCVYLALYGMSVGWIARDIYVFSEHVYFLMAAGSWPYKQEGYMMLPHCKRHWGCADTMTCANGTQRLFCSRLFAVHSLMSVVCSILLLSGSDLCKSP